MITIMLDGKKILTEEDFHKESVIHFDFPSYYGRNFDAFWDCFVDFLIANIEEDVVVEWRDHEISKNSLGEDKFTCILKIFADAKARWHNIKLHLL